MPYGTPLSEDQIDALILKDEGDNGDVPVIDEAAWRDTPSDRIGKLFVAGTAESRDRVEIINYNTGDQLFFTRADSDGAFDSTRALRVSNAPCTVAAVVDGVSSKPVEVENAPGVCMVGDEP